MRFRRLLASMLFVLLAPLSIAQAQRGGAPVWELLGQQQVGFRADNDAIDIRQNDEWHRSRAFARLRFDAERNDVQLNSITLNFINGYSEQVSINRLIPRNGQLIVDLPGERSFLKSIGMRYRANPLSGGGLNLRAAVVKVYGDRINRRWEREAPPASRPIADLGPGWSEIDTQRFDRRDSRVVFSARRGDGRVGQIRLRSETGEGIVVDNLRVRFRNGETQVVRIDQRLEAGEATRPIDLPGEARFLDSVTVTLSPRNRSGRVQLALLGTRRSGNESIGPAPGRSDAFEQRGLVLLGEQFVGFTTDRDAVDISRTEDWHRTRAFRSLHFVVDRSEVHLMGLRLVYINGYAEDMSVDRLIPVGGDFAVELRGERSFLRRVEMTYRARPSFRGQAVVRVYGEPVRR